MQKRSLITGLLITAMVVLSLAPLGRLIGDRIRYAGLVTESVETRPTRAFDWVHWDDRDGQITAVYVFPKGPGAMAGIEQGDILYEFDFNQYFNSNEIKQIIGGVPPGQRRTYTILRENDVLLVEVRLSQYPVFLYPLGSALWSASVWGFVLGAFIHLLALIIVIPLSLRSRSALLSLLLIAASSVWVFGNLSRILLLTWFGPVEVFASLGGFFQVLTLGSLGGWIAFPVLLVYKVLWDIRRLSPVSWIPALVLAVPPVLLVTSAALAVTNTALIAPVTLESLIAPILFYVSCYIAAATLLSLFFGGEPGPTESADAEPDRPAWSRLGSVIVASVALLAALSIFGVVPIFGIITDEAAGWIVVGAQLLSVAPVLLISFATLKYGRIDQVLRRSLTYVTVLGLFFFLFVGGLTWILEDIERLGAPVVLIAGLYAVLLLFLFDRGWRLIGPYTLEFFRTDRQKARQRVSEFSERMRSILSVDELADSSASTVFAILEPTHASIHLVTDERPITTVCPAGSAGISSETLAKVWPHFESHPEMWARNPELNPSKVPSEIAHRLLASGAALVVPLVDEDKLIGLFVLGRKKKRRAVYTLEDVELLRSLCTHLALSVERLEHIEREKELIRTTAESQLTALRAQINPHFLFNTLNAIAALIEEKPEQAEQTVEHLSAIFRHTLEASGQPFVTLEREMVLVERYLAIEQIRFGSRLQVEKNIDPDLARLLIPAFSIQTLVENAVTHGISKQRRGGLVRISARRDAKAAANPATRASDSNGDGDPELAEIEILDTGVGIPSLFGKGQVSAAEVDFLGIGMINVTTRLEKLYDRSDLLSIECRQGDGTRVIMRIPVQSGVFAEPNES